MCKIFILKIHKSIKKSPLIFHLNWWNSYIRLSRRSLIFYFELFERMQVYLFHNTQFIINVLPHIVLEIPLWLFFLLFLVLFLSLLLGLGHCIGDSFAIRSKIMHLMEPEAGETEQVPCLKVSNEHPQGPPFGDSFLGDEYGACIQPVLHFLFSFWRNKVESFLSFKN